MGVFFIMNAKTRKLTTMALLVAISIVLVYLIHFPIFPAAAFGQNRSARGLYRRWGLSPRPEDILFRCPFLLYRLLQEMQPLFWISADKFTGFFIDITYREV